MGAGVRPERTLRMTILATWVRTLRTVEELVFVSDSRLSGDGTNFDSCPKILTLPRTDCAIGFAGYTGHAFPMMLQLDLAISSYAPARRGGLDISSLKQHALKVFDSMAAEIHSSPAVSVEQNTDPEANFIFGGYSWVKKSFEMWSISYQPSEECFVARPAQWVRYHPDAKKFVFAGVEHLKSARVAFAGNEAPNARALLLNLLNQKYPAGVGFQGLDWEPFEVIRNMLRNPAHSETIGGAPQVVNVYPYFQATPLAVYWPNRASRTVVLQGRPCLGYENIDRWILDPDTLTSHHPAFSPTAMSEPGGPDEIEPAGLETEDSVADQADGYIHNN